MRAKYGVLCAVVIGTCLASEVRGQQPISWQPNLDIAKRIAAQTNRLVLIHFWSTSCGPCQRMEHEVFPRPEVAAAMEAAYVPVKLNADYFPATARQFGVRALPTDVVITPQGQVVQTNVGALAANRYVDMLNQIAASTPRDPAANYAQMPAGEGPGLGQIATASIPGQPAAPPANYPAPTYPANPYGAQGENPGPAQAAAPMQPSYNGPQLPYNTPQAELAGPAPGPTAAQPSGAIAGGPMLPQYSGLPSSSNPNALPQAAAPNPSNLAMADAGQARQGWSLPAGNPPGQPPAAAGAYPGANRPHAPTQPPLNWQANGSNLPSGSPPNAASPASGNRPAASPVHAGNPPLALDGYCPVQLGERERWTKGDPRWGVIHRGRTYLFAGPEEQKRFLADPDRYSPVLSGDDIVLSLEQQQSVSGRREHGVWFEGRVYLFASEESLRRFDLDPYRYARAITAKTAPPAMEANHGAAVGANPRY